MTNEQYLKELFKMFFLANLYVDFAVIKIHDNLTITIDECIKLIDKITIENIKQNAEYEHLKKYVKEGDTLELVLCKYKYNTPIIESPAVILQEHNKFCDLIKSSTTINTGQMKVIGLRNAYTAYTNTCSQLYAASNYTYLSNQAATFMIYYWTDLVNSYLITKAIRDTDCILLIIDKHYVNYDDRSRFTANSSVHRNMERLFTKRKYLGYLKFNLYDEKSNKNCIRIIFLFLYRYEIEMYDIYGSPIHYGSIISSTFLTAQELTMLTTNNCKAYLDLENKGDKIHVYWINPLREIPKTIQEKISKMYEITNNFFSYANTYTVKSPDDFVVSQLHELTYDKLIEMKEQILDKKKDIKKSVYVIPQKRQQKNSGKVNKLKYLELKKIKT